MGKRRRGASRREVAWLKKLDAELAQQLESVEEWAAAHRREHEEGAATYAEHTAIGKTLVEIFDHVQAVEMAPAVAEGDVFSKGGEGPARRNFDLEQIEVALAEDGVVSPFATSTHAVDVALAPGWDGLELATLRDAIYIVAARKWEAEAMKKEDAEAHSTNGCGEERGDGEGFMAQPLWRATTAALSWDDVLITYAPAFTWGDWSAVADLLASAMHLAREPHPNRGALNCAVMWHTRLADSVVSPVPSSQSYLTAFDHATQVKLREAVKSYIDANQQPDGGLPSGAVSDLCARVLSATGVRLLPHQALRLEAEYRLAFQRPVPTETVNDVFTSHELSLLRELLAEHTQAHPDFLHSTFRQEARARQGREVAKASAAGKTVTKVTRATGQSKKQNAPPAAPQPYRLAYRLGLKRSFVTWAWAQRYMLPGFAQTPPPLSLIRNPPRLATPRQSLENLVAAACYGVGDREIKPYTPGAVKENQGPALQKKRLRHPWAVGLEPQMSRISAVTGRFGEGYGVYAVGKYARWQHASFGERLRRLHRCSTTRVPAARDAPEGRRTVTRRFRGSAETHPQKGLPSPATSCSSTAAAPKKRRRV
eukprot:TRINITY_DN5479_c0_g2_i4.p1 TRINITY_DN5479_c0_g2~~TRINITY_DN5479_c0_g2_i4.p1  ORF type:complete len:596 (+),score=110.56 TRINITY_DN5479_c0_g2_i4:49-1836(+)